MRLLLGFCLSSLALFGQLTAEQKHRNLASFEKVWTTVRDKHWEKNPGGLDWQAVHREFLPKMEAAQSMDQARAVLREMLGRLKQTHFTILPSGIYDNVTLENAGDASPGIDTRVLKDHVVVTRVDAGSPAERAGVKPGWEIASVEGTALAPVVEKLEADSAVRELTLERAVQSRLTGAPGGTMHFVFLDGADRETPLDLALVPPRGKTSSFGNLPPMHVWFESKKIGETGYIGFNVFLDLPRVMASFADAVKSCMNCNGLIVDLRGNPGGIGGMAMGMAGWLVDKPDERLGTMQLRDATVNFVINPRAEVFTGPVAILVDGSSASTSEIFAGGLKDLGRARIFGTLTAAAALPSVIEKLPNGDGFQYAIANYISEGGQPLEGVGVTPDVEVSLTREALLAGHDPVVDAALDWIRKQRKSK
jgi:carboxyl-terminal processing protease